MKTGLIMAGGAMRGMFTAGVMDIMMDNGISFDGAIGVSAGAVFGCNYKSGQSGRVIRYNKRFCNDRRYCSFWSLLTTGDLYGADFCYRILPEQLDLFDREAYQQNPMEFHVVCTDMETGQPVYHQCQDGGTDDLKWMRASASIPVVSRPVAVDGRKLLDGGISDSIPVRYFESIGYRKNVIILTQPEDYIKQPLKILPLLRILYPRKKPLLHAIAHRYEVYNQTTEYIRQLEKEGRAFVIRPRSSLNIGSVEHDPAELERVYQEGLQAMTGRLSALKTFLTHSSSS